VEGGGTLTVIFEKEGLITTHRKVYVPWNDIAIAETIEMIPEDTKSTDLTLDGNPNTILSHQSTIVTDDRGSRSSTVVFTGDNRAYSMDASGNVIQELTTVATRSTEFITENSMPAKLPPNSAYTYCVELSVDGARRVRFDKPVILWVDNFLGFNVGEAVPVGYYDRDRGVWVPSDNGVVVRLLDTNGDGIVDVLDANGDGQPDDLNNDGAFSDEVIGLNDPQRYPPGSTFWRVAITHFSPWDLNWPYYFPSDAISPNPVGNPEADQQKTEEDDCQNSGSTIEVRSEIFHEDIAIPGTNMTLHYASNRVKGFHHKITVPASGAEVPASLKSITVKLGVAGRTFEHTLSPFPNQKAEFIWDGLDFLGRPVKGSPIAHVGIGFVYNGVYWSAGGIVRAFGQPGSQTTRVLTRQEIISWKSSDIINTISKTKGTIAEGWTLSVHHTLNLMDPSTLYKGDGTITKRNVLVIDTIAGNGIGGYGGDGGLATEANIYGPYGLTLDSAGSLYFADGFNRRIRKVDSNGIITTIAGNGQSGYSGDGGLATQAKLNYPYGIALDGNGNLYIADSYNNRIRKVDTNGIVTTVAGTGMTIDNGDGRPANQANLYRPYGVAIDKDNNLYIAETYNNRIRKVDTSGIITTVAGNGIAGYSGDGGSAVAARIDHPYGVAVDSIGNLFIADTYNDRIRMVNASGIIITIAGNGMQGYGGDEGPATQASLNNPMGIGVNTVGDLYIADTYNYRIRKVDTSGIITTVAGGGVPESEWPHYGGDSGSPIEAVLGHAECVAVDGSGNLYIADTPNMRIRKVGVPSAFERLRAVGDIVFPEENGWGHILSSAGRHKTTVDLDTGRVLYTSGYDQNNNLMTITDQFGNKTTIQRNASGVPIAIISPDSLATTLTIDANNILTRITYPDASFYGFEYAQEGLMTAKIEPEGNRFEHIFNSSGRLIGVSDQEGGYWQYSRSIYPNGDIQTQVLSAEGTLTSYLDHTDSTGAYTSHITDPSGAETVYTRSADKLAATKSLPCGMNLTFKYGIHPQYKFKFAKEMRQMTTSGLEKVIFREKTYEDTNSDKIPDLITAKAMLNGKASTLVTNTLQAKQVLTTPAGRSLVASYDPNTLLTTALTIPGLYDTNFGYDNKGRLTSVNINNRQATFGYDTQGNLFFIIDPENRITTYSYDAVGQMTGILRPDSSSISFRYDKNGNLTVLSNPSSINHGFGYNKVNLNSSYQTPVSGSYSYSYNKDRQLKQVRFPSGKQINLLYDYERLSNIQTPDGNISLSYLCGSKVGSITKGGETIGYGYDGSLVTSETSGGTLNENLSYAYNNDFNFKSLTYSGGTVNYTYDSDGLLTGAGSFTIIRNAGNGLPEAVTGGALNFARTFNGYGELDNQDFVVNGLTLASWRVTRDKNGRIASKTETVEGVTFNYSYEYDPEGRLLTVTKDGALIGQYQYDSIGRCTYEMNVLKGISGRTLSYSDEDHLLAAGDTTYQHDLDGFLTTKTTGTDTTRYGYSSRGELLRADLSDGSVIEYVNDPMGRRIAKKVDGLVTEKYLWQGLTRLLAVYDGSNNLIMRFDYADARMPVAMARTGTTYYLTYDQVGSLRIVADSSGNVIKRIDYDPFGSVITDTNPGFQVPFGFAGGLRDRDTGLVRFGSRDYDPEVGRWTAKDPIGFAGGDVDLYGYVANNPVKFIDPWGLWRAPGHRALTTGPMTASNAFTTADIARAVQSNLNVDRLSNQFNDPAHYMPGTQAAAEALISNLLERAIQLERAGQHAEAMDALGEGLHTVQDRYSHFQQNAGWGAHIRGGACDDPARNTQGFTDAQNASRIYIEQFLRRTRRR
jgi:RHS repeat-associated protein